MSGKTPSRFKRPRNARPYDRPRQGLLGRMASTVKGLFKPSSWLNWGQSAAGDEDSTEIPIAPNWTEPDLTENEEDQAGGSLERPRQPCTKRPRLEINSVSVSSVSQPPFWLGPSTSRQTFLPEDIHHTNAPTVAPRCDARKTDSTIVLNGDDHSENSDGSASTSGCSSLVSSQDKPRRSSGLKLSESVIEQLRAEVKNKQGFKRPCPDLSISPNPYSSLNSNHSGNRSTWCHGSVNPNFQIRSSPAQNSRPSFNISSLSNPSRLNPNLSKNMKSPFYDGNTTFGGASAYRIKTAPYQLNNSNKQVRSQIKVKDSQSAKEFECMSTAAKRILNTLEKMSTPISDAKKIPVVQSPIHVSFSPSQSLNLYSSISRRSPAPRTIGPPIVNLSAVTKVPILKNRNLRLSKNTILPTPLKEQPIVKVPEECLASSQAPGPSKSAGGKMKSKFSEPQHVSSRRKDDEIQEPEYELPDVPLPVTSLPIFNLAPKTAQKRTQLTPERTNFEPPQMPAFTFANPIERSSPVTALNTIKDNGRQGDGFQFSSPLVVKLKTNTEAEKTATKEVEIITNGSVNDFLKKMTDQRSVEQPKSLDKFKPKSNTWTCSSCWITNQETHSKCLACETQRPASKSQSDFGDKFKPKQNSWECSTCMVRNDNPDSTECVACQSRRPGAAVEKSSIKNTTVTASTISPFLTKITTSAASGAWKCDVCFVSNPATSKTCSACESLKVQKKESSDTFSFKSSGFQDNSFKMDAKSTAATSVSAVATPTFTFGSVSASTEPAFGSTSSTGFRFGSQCSTPPVFGSSSSFSTTLAGAVPSPVSVASKVRDHQPASEKVEFPGETATAEAKGLTQSSQSTADGFDFKAQLSRSQDSSSQQGFKFSAQDTKNTPYKDPKLNSQFPKSSPSTEAFKFGAQSFQSSQFGEGFKFGASLAPSTTTTATEARSTNKAFEFKPSFQFPVSSANTETFSSVSNSVQHSNTITSTTTAASTMSTTAGMQPLSKPSVEGNNVALFPVVSSTETDPNKLNQSFFGGNAMSPVQPTVSSLGSSAPICTVTSTKPLFGTFQASAFNSPTKNNALSSISTPNSQTFPIFTAASSAAATSPSTTTAAFVFNPVTSFTAKPKSASDKPNELLRAQLGQSPVSQPLTSGFVFGGATNTAAPSMAQGGFGSIVSSPPSYDSTQKPPQSVFSFNAKPSVDQKIPHGGFSFNAGSDSKLFNAMPFGAQPAASSSASEIGANTPPSTVFKFGTSQPSVATPATGGFVFGQQKSEAAKAPAFGGFATPAKSPALANFNFGAPSSTSTPVAPSFNPQGTAPFTFGMKSTVPTAAVTPVNQTLIFGAAPANPGQSMFCAIGTTPAFNAASGQSFGAPQATNTVSVPTFGAPQNTEPIGGGFNFNAAASAPFQFGDVAGKKPTIPSQPPSGFNFTMTPQVDPTPGFAPSLNVSPFNFGATSSAPNAPFKFNAGTGDNVSVSTPAPRRMKKGIRRVNRN